MGVYWVNEHCPKCGDFNKMKGMDIQDLWDPHPDAYDLKYHGRTYRELGISGRGKWNTYHCEKCGHVWAKLRKRYE